jgi:hypothetical protein
VKRAAPLWSAGAPVATDAMLDVVPAWAFVGAGADRYFDENDSQLHLLQTHAAAPGWSSFQDIPDLASAWSDALARGGDAFDTGDGLQGRALALPSVPTDSLPAVPQRPPRLLARLALSLLLVLATLLGLLWMVLAVPRMVRTLPPSEARLVTLCLMALLALGGMQRVLTYRALSHRSPLRSTLFFGNLL